MPHTRWVEAVFQSLSACRSLLSCGAGRPGVGLPVKPDARSPVKLISMFYVIHSIQYCVLTFRCACVCWLYCFELYKMKKKRLARVLCYWYAMYIYIFGDRILNTKITKTWLQAWKWMEIKKKTLIKVNNYHYNYTVNLSTTSIPYTPPHHHSTPHLYPLHHHTTTQHHTHTLYTTTPPLNTTPIPSTQPQHHSTPHPYPIHHHTTTQHHTYTIYTTTTPLNTTPIPYTPPQHHSTPLHLFQHPFLHTINSLTR